MIQLPMYRYTMCCVPYLTRPTDGGGPGTSWSLALIDGSTLVLTAESPAVAGPDLRTFPASTSAFLKYYVE